MTPEQRDLIIRDFAESLDALMATPGPRTMRTVWQSSRVESVGATEEDRRPKLAVYLTTNPKHYANFNEALGAADSTTHAWFTNKQMGLNKSPQ